MPCRHLLAVHWRFTGGLGVYWRFRGFVCIAWVVARSRGDALPEPLLPAAAIHAGLSCDLLHRVPAGYGQIACHTAANVARNRPGIRQEHCDAHGVAVICLAGCQAGCAIRPRRCCSGADLCGTLAGGES